MENYFLDLGSALWPRSVDAPRWRENWRLLIRICSLMTKLIADGPEFACIITFLAIVKCKDKQSAAKWLGIATGTVTKQVGRLEKWFGHKLLTTSRPPQLTPMGRQTVELFESFARSMCVLRGSVPTFTETGYVSDPDSDVLNSLLFPPKVI